MSGHLPLRMLGRARGRVCQAVCLGLSSLVRTRESHSSSIKLCVSIPHHPLGYVSVSLQRFASVRISSMLFNHPNPSVSRKLSKFVSITLILIDLAFLSIHHLLSHTIFLPFSLAEHGAHLFLPCSFSCIHPHASHFSPVSDREFFYFSASFSVLIVVFLFSFSLIIVKVLDFCPSILPVLSAKSLYSRLLPMIFLIDSFEIPDRLQYHSLTRRERLPKACRHSSGKFARI